MLERHFAFPRRQQRPVISGGGGGESDACPCECVPSGDIMVNGVETTIKWSLPMPISVFKKINGTITLPAGTYIVEYTYADGTWALDVGDELTSAYSDGSDATAESVLEGTLTMVYPEEGEAYVMLCVDGTIGEEE